MSYQYKDMKPSLFTEEGSVKFTKVRDHVRGLFKTAGACSYDAAISCVSGDTWANLACLDRLIELKEAECIELPNRSTQDWILIPGVNKL